MPGIAARIIVTDFVRDRLSADSSSQAPLFTDPATAPFVALGALGPALADLIAAEPDVGDNAPNSWYYRAWLPILQLLADSNTTTPPTPGVLSNLRTIRETLNQLRPILAARDKLALIGMAGQLSGLSKVVSNLQTQMASLTLSRITIATNIFNAEPKPKVPPSSSWQPRDTMQMSKTGRFVGELRHLAEQSGAAAQQAYAIGATVGTRTTCAVVASSTALSAALSATIGGVNDLSPTTSMRGPTAITA